jgi:Raf kinase inhibitor-like YbhB/YbcL family protein
MAFAISSTAFPDGGDIPRKFTCDGADVSPELSWSEPPSGTQSFTLIADDPDAPVGTWTHWVLYDLPAAATGLAEGVNKIDELPEASARPQRLPRGRQRPCPPPANLRYFSNSTHSMESGPQTGREPQEVEQALQSLVLGQAEWMGKYRR